LPVDDSYADVVISELSRKPIFLWQKQEKNISGEIQSVLNDPRDILWQKGEKNQGDMTWGEG
jgi:hypothetical protein